MIATALIAPAALLSALLLYGASGHCLWGGLHTRVRGLGRFAGLALALLSLGFAVVAHGIGAGLCIALAAWMIGLVGWPYFAWATHARRPR